MAKALELTADTLNVVPPVPKAAQVNMPAAEQKRSNTVVAKIKREPLQVRWPAEDVKAVKLAALQQDFPSVSDFMLACFHAYMKTQRPT
jgi:hypothetical protein